MTLGSEMYAIRDLFVACPPVYTLPGTWSDPEKNGDHKNDFFSMPTCIHFAWYLE